MKWSCDQWSTSDLNEHSSTIISFLIDIIQWKFWQVLLDFQKGGYHSNTLPTSEIQGRVQDFRLRRAEEGAKFFGVFREISISYLRTRHQTSYWNEWMNFILINQIHIVTEMLTVTHKIYSVVQSLWCHTHSSAENYLGTF